MIEALRMARAEARSPCGSLWLEIAGTETCLRPSGALWLEGEGALVAGDLHLEKGSAYAARGQLLPPYDTVETLRRLQLEIEALQPRTVVLLGDSFHDADAGRRLSDQGRGALIAIGRRAEIVWVTGNHDPEPPEGLPGRRAGALTLGGLDLRHEPSPAPVRAEAAGHLHPCARVVAGGGSVRRRCFITDGERLILPAFGAYAGGLNVRDRAFEALFVREPVAAVLGPRRVHPAAWRTLVGD